MTSESQYFGRIQHWQICWSGPRRLGGAQRRLGRDPSPSYLPWASCRPARRRFTVQDGSRRAAARFGALRRSAQRSAAGMRLRNAASMRVKRVGRALSARPATRALARSPQRQLCAGRKRISRCLSESVRGGGDRRPLQNLSRRMHSVAFRNMPRTWIRKPPKKRT